MMLACTAIRKGREGVGANVQAASNRGTSVSSGTSCLLWLCNWPATMSQTCDLSTLLKSSPLLACPKISRCASRESSVYD